MMLEMETPMIKRKIPGGGTEYVDLWSLLVSNSDYFFQQS